MSLLILSLLLVAADRPDGFLDPPDTAKDLTSVVRDDFERTDRDSWEFTDPAAWRFIEQGPGANHVLEQFQQSKYQPAVRSPFNIAIARRWDVSDLVLDVDVRSTAPDTANRDICIVFNYRDPGHFYYAHVAKRADEHHNSVFLVNGQPRASIAENRSQGVKWDDGWHHVRVVRRVKDGLIQVYFDDMKTPIMTAHDTTIVRGRIGLGSFDDTAQFDNLQVWGRTGG